MQLFDDDQHHWMYLNYTNKKIPFKIPTLHAVYINQFLPMRFIYLNLQLSFFNKRTNPLKKIFIVQRLYLPMHSLSLPLPLPLPLSLSLITWWERWTYCRYNNHYNNYVFPQQGQTRKRETLTPLYIYICIHMDTKVVCQQKPT